MPLLPRKPIPSLSPFDRTPPEPPIPKQPWRQSARKVDTKVRKDSQIFMVVGFEFAKEERLEISGTLNLKEDESRGFLKNRTHISDTNGVLTIEEDAEIGYGTLPNVNLPPEMTTSELEVYIAEFKAEWKLPFSINEGLAVYCKQKVLELGEELKANDLEESGRDGYIGTNLRDTKEKIGSLRLEPSNAPAFTDNEDHGPANVPIITDDDGATLSADPVTPRKSPMDPNDPMAGLKMSPGPDKEQMNSIARRFADLVLGIEEKPDKMSTKPKDKRIRNLPLFQNMANTYFRGPVFKKALIATPNPEPAYLKKKWVYDSDSDEDGGVEIGNVRTLYEDLWDFREACRFQFKRSILGESSLSMIANFVNDNKRNLAVFGDFQAAMGDLKNFQEAVRNAAL